MKKRILIPLDLMRSPCDALMFARNLAAERPICITLLYVLNLNIGLPAAQIYAELHIESEKALRKLARLFFGSDEAVRIVVREGRPHEEIVAEARSTAADLVVLAGPARHNWTEFLRLGTTQKVIDAAPCPTVVLPRHEKIEHHRPPIARIEPSPVEVLLGAA
jgi:nucleotide-binding universal stress UspA family protein